MLASIQYRHARSWFPVILGVCLLGGLPVRAGEKDAAQDSKQESTTADETRFETLRGKVVWFSDVVKRKYGLELDEDARHQLCVLEATDGNIYPILKDLRGRGFWKDKRWRDRPVQLRVKRFPGTRAIQIVRTYSIKDGRLYHLDYWCDICAIPMYELKVCECCQGPIRIRERLIGKLQPLEKYQDE